MRVQDFMSFQSHEQDLADKMEIFDKINNAANNYLNLAAFYGFENEEALACLYRGMRNVFWLGVYFVRQQEFIERGNDEG